MSHHNEPWKHDGDGDILDAKGDDVACAYLRSDDVAEDRACRIVACVNACAGMADPAAEIAALRGEVERLKAAAIPAGWQMVPEQPVDDFKRELRYIVIKVKDALAYLPAHKRIILDSICDEIARGRAFVGKPPLNAVVVEQDWPEYEPTWTAIQSRMAGASAPDVGVLIEALRKIAACPGDNRLTTAIAIAREALAEWEAKR